jgi:hypothetical protein
MDRETLLMLALGLLVLGALTVGACGWTLFARDRRADPVRTLDAAHTGDHGDA